MTEGYSGADIELVCREAAMRPVRRLVQRIRELDTNGAPNSLPEPAPTGKTSAVRAPLAAALRGAAVDAESLLKADPVTQEDLRAALETTKSSSDGCMDK